MAKEEKSLLLKVWHQYKGIEDRKDYCFNELKEMSGELGMSKWCSAESNLKQMIGNKTPYEKNGSNTTYENKAWYLYNEYVELLGKLYMLQELGCALAGCDIWK